MAIGLLITYTANLNARYDVNIIGEVPTGLAAPKLPNFQNAKDLFSVAIPIGIVGYAVHVPTGMILASQSGQLRKINANQELLAIGLINVIGAFFCCMPVFSAMSRSTVQLGSGGKTQVAGLVSSSFLLLIIFLAGPVFYHVPKLSLSVIVIVAITSLIRKRINEGKLYWKIDKLDFTVWLVSALAAVFVDIVYGLISAFLISYFSVVLRVQTEKEELQFVESASGGVLYVKTNLTYLSADRFNKKVDKMFASENLLSKNFTKLTIDLTGIVLLDYVGMLSLAGLVKNLKKDNRISVILSREMKSKMKLLANFDDEEFEKIFQDRSILKSVQESKL